MSMTWFETIDSSTPTTSKHRTKAYPAPALPVDLKTMKDIIYYGIKHVHAEILEGDHGCTS